MQALLVKYLWVTGFGAALVLAMPSLVIVGLIALIVPGVILALMPTAFAYGVVFALAWFPLHRALGDWPAAAVAAAVTLGVFWWIPISGNAATRARYEAERAEDVLPTAPVALRGSVRLETRTLHAERDRPSPAAAGSARRDPAAARCSPLCAALLFTEGVTAVTTQHEVTDARGAGPVSPRGTTFRLVPRDRCAAPVEPSFDQDAFGADPLRAHADAWKLRLSTTDCIVAGPPREDADLVVVLSRFTTPLPDEARSRGVSIGPRPVRVERLELFDRAGRLLLRRTVARAVRVVQPMFVAPEGGTSDFGFRIASAPFGPKHEELRPFALLVEHTSLDARPPGGELAGALRARLAELLDDPAAPATDPGFGLVEGFLKAMAAAGAPPDDLLLLVRLVEDRRVRRFDGLWGAVKPLGPRLERLRAPIVARLRAADPVRDAGIDALGHVLDALPAGAFAELRPDEAALVADLDRHRFAAAIIGRQADRGAAAVPLLARLLDAQVRRLAALQGDRAVRSDDPRKNSARSGISAVRRALCRLGPAGAAALPTIDALEREGLFDRFAGERDWQLTVVRLGRPLEAIPKPANLSGTEASFHDHLRRRLERFDPARDCHP